MAEGRREGKGEPIALRLQQREKKRGREQKSDSLTAAPNGFSGEREGAQRRGEERRRRHNEGAMTEAEIDLERWMEGETKRGRGYTATR